VVRHHGPLRPEPVARPDLTSLWAALVVLGTVLIFATLVSLAASGKLGCMELEGTIRDANLRSACVDK
jgi:hypothetical protein